MWVYALISFLNISHTPFKYTSNNREDGSNKFESTKPCTVDRQPHIPLCPTLTSLGDDFYQTVCSHNTFSQKSVNETSRIDKGRVETIIFDRPQANQPLKDGVLD